jgi:phage regulator Rha-like protein
MTQIIHINKVQTMTSLEIAELTGKQHKDVLKAIRNMEPAWVKVNGRNFALVEYKDAKGELRPITRCHITRVPGTLFTHMLW